MSDQQPEETRTEQQPWPPAPEGSHDAPPTEPSSEIAKGVGLGIIAGLGFTLVAVVVCVCISLYFFMVVYGPAVSTILLVMPLGPEFFLARRFYRKQKTMGWTLGIVSMSVSVLTGIAMVLALIAIGKISM